MSFLFNQKILFVLDSGFRSSFFVLWVLFDTIQSLNRLPYQIKKNFSMFISGFHHQIMSGSLQEFTRVLSLIIVHNSSRELHEQRP